MLNYLKEQLNYDLRTFNNKAKMLIRITCHLESKDVVKHFVEECSVDINSEDKEGNTPIILAAQEGHLAVVEYLITQGLDSLPKNALVLFQSIMPL